MKKIKKYAIFMMILCILPQIINAAESVADEKKSCGAIGYGGISGIPPKIPELTSFFVTIAQVAAVVILIILGSIDLFKGMTSGQEEEIKKGQQIFIKRLIIGSLVFFIVLGVKILVGVVANSSSTNIIECMDCFINNKCNGDIVVKDDTNSNGSDTYNTNAYSKETESPKKNTLSAKKKAKKSSYTSTNSNSSRNNANTKSKVKKNTIFVGDSEVVGMCEQHKLCNGDKYVAKVGAWCSYLNEQATQKAISNKIGSKEYNIVIVLGSNGVGDDSSSVDSYVNECFGIVSKLAKNKWKKHNILYLSINKCDDEVAKKYYIISNAAINAFNKKMKNKIYSAKLSNLTYCDTNSSLTGSDIFMPDDGLHYNKKGAKQVYDTIKNKCLK